VESLAAAARALVREHLREPFHLTLLNLGATNFREGVSSSGAGIFGAWRGVAGGDKQAIAPGAQPSWAESMPGLGGKRGAPLASEIASEIAKNLLSKSEQRTSAQQLGRNSLSQMPTQLGPSLSRSPFSTAQSVRDLDWASVARLHANKSDLNNPNVADGGSDFRREDFWRELGEAGEEDRDGRNEERILENSKRPGASSLSAPGTPSLQFKPGSELESHSPRIKKREWELARSPGSPFPTPPGSTCDGPRAAEGAWICEACTFENAKPLAPICEVCATARPPPQLPVGGGSSNSGRAPGVSGPQTPRAAKQSRSLGVGATQHSAEREKRTQLGTIERFLPRRPGPEPP